MRGKYDGDALLVRLQPVRYHCAQGGGDCLGHARVFAAELFGQLGLFLRDLRAGVFVLRDTRLVAFEFGFQVCFQLIDVALSRPAWRASVNYARNFDDRGFAA